MDQFAPVAATRKTSRAAVLLFELLFRVVKNVYNRWSYRRVDFSSYLVTDLNLSRDSYTICK